MLRCVKCTDTSAMPPTAGDEAANIIFEHRHEAHVAEKNERNNCLLKKGGGLMKRKLLGLIVVGLILASLGPGVGQVPERPINIVVYLKPGGAGMCSREG